MKDVITPKKSKAKKPLAATSDLFAANPSGEAVEILEALRLQAAKIVGAALGTATLSNFATTGLGNFPYMWENPANLEFNQKTYDWINANLKADTTPTEQASGSTFTNIFANALASTTYSLSSEDQAELNKAAREATIQQGALLTAWRAAYGSLPKAKTGETPTDVIVNTILTKWATNPPATLTEVQNASNLNALLGNTPASGQPILPVFSNWVNALGASVSLQNAVSMNNGQKNAALDAVKNPTLDNGALSIAGTLLPAYKVATPTSDILNGLADKSNAAVVKMSVSRFSSSEYSVKVTGQAGFNIPILSFFTMNVGANASFFQEKIATQSNSIEMELSFTGVTLAQYAPVAYNDATNKDWFFTSPIIDAIAAGNDDVSSFKFKPDPRIDFSENGPFGLMNTIVFSNYPDVKIVVKSAEYKSIATTIEQSASVGLSFLGIPLGFGGQEATYSKEVDTDSSSESVTITLSAPPELVAGSVVDSEGWILGVVTEYPGA